MWITGASGFIGRALLRRLRGAGYPDILVLTRDPSRVRLPPGAPPGWRVIAGDVSTGGAWEAQLAGCECVVHLAAQTGKAPRRVHQDVTVGGTARLVAAAHAAGVRRILGVSSIAVAYQERPHYHYAEAKAAAEALVIGSGLEHFVFRPTLVLGPGSPLLDSLSRLAGLPIPVTFGNGTPSVQPIHVEDLADLLAAALLLPRWEGQVVAAGGPEVLSLDELMGRLRALHRLDARSPLHLPLGPMRLALALLEPLLLPLLPFTAGQLAFFANPSVATGPLPPGLPAPRRSLAEMLMSGDPA